MIEDEKVTITQATEMGFGSRSTLMRLLRKGWIHSTMVGGKHLLDVAELARVRGSRDTEHECYLRLAKAIARDAPSIDPHMIKYLVREMNYIGGMRLKKPEPEPVDDYDDYDGYYLVEDEDWSS